MKTHWKKLTNPDYLGSYDFEPNEKRVVTILNVTREMITGAEGKKEECTIAKLHNSKPMILNKTNCKAITKAYGTPYIEDWVNISITLYVAKVKAFGDTVDALRVEMTKPIVSKIDYSKQAEQLRACVTLEELQTVYKNIGAPAQLALVAVKDEMKLKLSK
jgi:hypothetical protein